MGLAIGIFSCSADMSSIIGDKYFPYEDAAAGNNDAGVNDAGTDSDVNSGDAGSDASDMSDASDAGFNADAHADADPD